MFIQWNLSIADMLYSKHLSIADTNFGNQLKRFYWALHLYSGHLSIADIFFGNQLCPLLRGSTVYSRMEPFIVERFDITFILFQSSLNTLRSSIYPDVDWPLRCCLQCLLPTMLIRDKWLPSCFNGNLDSHATLAYCIKCIHIHTCILYEMHTISALKFFSFCISDYT